METDNNKMRMLKLLTDAGIKPSAQRIAILEYISSSKIHPTVEDIYSFLVRDNPTLSRTTVFSSVKLLAEKGLVNDINLSSDSTRYDSADYEPHAHFMCRICRRIFDVPLDMSSVPVPADYQCDNVNVFFKGICPECSEHSK